MTELIKRIETAIKEFREETPSNDSAVVISTLNWVLKQIKEIKKSGIINLMNKKIREAKIKLLKELDKQHKEMLKKLEYDFVAEYKKLKAEYFGFKVKYNAIIQLIRDWKKEGKI